MKAEVYFLKLPPYPVSFSTKHIKGKVTLFGMEPIFEWKWYAFTVYASCFICVFLKSMFFLIDLIWNEKNCGIKNDWKLVFLNQKYILKLAYIQHTITHVWQTIGSWDLLLTFIEILLFKNSKYRDFTFDWFSFWHLKWLSHRVSKCKLTITWTWQGSGRRHICPKSGDKMPSPKIGKLKSGVLSSRLTLIPPSFSK